MGKYQKKLYILVGAPGSGKSSWIQNHERHFNPSHKVISRDEIRFNLVAENEPYFSKEKEVYREFIRQIKSSLEANIETYADATHINEASRGKLLRALGEDLKDVEVYAIVIKSPLSVILRQNRTREGRKFVPEAQIKNAYANLTIPTLEEGFNKIWIYKPGNRIITVFERSLN